VRNVEGKFQVKLFDRERDIKCSFGAVERLESIHFKPRSIMQVLNDAVNGNFYLNDVVNVIYEGLKANGDTRISYNEIGEEVIKNGMVNYASTIVEFLTYGISGETDITTEKDTSKKK
jgi:hypothetical protein